MTTTINDNRATAANPSTGIAAIPQKAKTLLPCGLHVLLSLSAIIFTMEFMTMWIIGELFSFSSYFAATMADSFILTLASAPFLWLFIIRPFASQPARAETLEALKERNNPEQSLRLAATIFENIGAATVITDSQNRIVSVNPAFTTITGFAPEEVIGRNPSIMKSGRHSKEFYCAMWESIINTGYWQGEIWDRRKNGELFPKWLSISTIKDKQSGKIHSYIAIFSDITEPKKDEERIRFLADYDALTGLPNRILLHDRLNQGLNHAVRNNRRLALLFLDLDRFKDVNDTLGHHVGDLLLQSVAARIKECLRAEDTVARLGGDEFVIILPDLQMTEYAGMVAGKIIKRVAAPHHLGEQKVFTTASIGISVYPDDGGDRETLLNNADTAMYNSKKSGRNNYLFFQEEMNATAMERLAMENSLRQAMEREEFTLYFQPQVDSFTELIIGAEALIRWQHPVMGMILPGKFMSIAEESGMIVDIGEWVLRTACMKNKAMQDQGLPALPVSVNLSAVQFRQENLVDLIADTLRQTGLAPQSLVLELTEKSIIQNPETAIDTLLALKDIGVGISIDDFGTSLSGLGFLKRFPIDTIKIDRSFIHEITTSLDDAIIVKAIITLARGLRMRVIAEGIETKAELDFLKIHGCDKAQGYYFSEPLAENEYRALLEGRVCRQDLQRIQVSGFR